jgi:hypothetical protein
MENMKQQQLILVYVRAVMMFQQITTLTEPVAVTVIPQNQYTAAV